MIILRGDKMNFTTELRCTRSLGRNRGHLHQAGFTLIELMITIAIMAVVVGTATLSFTTWQKKSRFESQVREMYADLMDARNMAFTQKKVHGIVFQPNSYVMKSYSSEVEYKYSADAKTNGTNIMTKSLKYGITKTNTTTAFTDDNSAILFDTTGFNSTSPSTSTFGFTIVVNPIDVSSGINCLVISVARVNMGKWNVSNSKCEFN
ncbi:MAG: prepilin-type N-terminal cleavage/methylation domain-containing protein [Desulfuromonadales bacterium]